MKKDPRVYLAQILERIDRIIEYTLAKFLTLNRKWRAFGGDHRGKMAFDNICDVVYI